MRRAESWCREKTSMQHDRRTPDTGETEPRTRGGSPDMKCHHALRQAATGTSAPEEINVSLVPLFLVPRAVADVIRRHGQAVREITVRRTRNHQYAISIERGRP